MLLGGTVRDDVVDGLVARTVVNLKVNHATRNQKLADLNLLGIDFLQEAIDSLPKAMVTLIYEKSVASAVKPMVWVQLINVADNPTQRSKSVPFLVTPVIPNIDGLKKAVQKERKDAGQTIDPLTMKVYAHDDATGAWVEVPEDASLVANVKATAYHVLVP